MQQRGRTLRLSLPNAFQATHELFGPPPRRLPWYRFRYHRPQPPEWLQADDRELSRLYTEYKDLLTRGELALAQIVQANTLLFEKGEGDCPAAVLYRPYPCSADESAELQAMASALYSLKGNESEATPELRELAAAITNEHEALYHRAISGRVSGKKLFYTTIMVCRKHLPGGYLAQGFLPLLVGPGRYLSAMILPSKYWAPELLTLWRVGVR